MAHYVDPSISNNFDRESESAYIEDLAGRGFIGRYENSVTLTEDFLLRVNARSVSENAQGQSRTTVDFSDRWGMHQFSVSFATKELAERYKPGSYFKLQAAPAPSKA